MTVELRWTNKRGAYRTRLLDHETVEKIWHRLDTLRCEAELTADGEKVGGIEDLDAGLGSYCDDRRRRWNAWMDKGAVETVLKRIRAEEAARYALPIRPEEVR